MRNILVMITILLGILVANIVYAVPAPFNEYYYNPETGECINHWRGDEHVRHPIPEGFYFSGYNHPNCTQKIFNLTKYRECKLRGGKYVMKSLREYECSFKICNTDEDCKSIECPSRNELLCTPVQFVKKVCINNQCVCKCSTEEWNLPKPPIGEELNYQGKIYVKTDEKYYKYIPEEYRVDLKDGTSIYVFDNAIYTLYAADPHHGSYIYIKWIEKESEKNDILLYVGAGVIILVICFLFWKLRKK